MNLRDTTRDIVGQVEQRAGYPVDVAQGCALPAPAGVRRAGRRTLPAHFIRCSPAGRRLPRSAAQVFIPSLAIDEFGPVAELARQGRTRVAQAEMRAGAVGGLRMDAVWTMASALEVFEDMTPEQVQQVGFECALLGRRGLGLNKAEPKVTLHSLPGEYSALHVVAIMVAAVKQFAPGTDLGIDLARKCEQAVAVKG